MGRTKMVVLTLHAPWKARNAIKLSKARHLVASAGKDFVRVTLMTDIPDQPIKGRLKDMMYRNREFDRTQV